MPRIPQPLDEERARRLREVAAVEFTTHGYERASLNRVIAETAMGKSSFYHYFADKRALYDYLVDWLTEALAGALRGFDHATATRETFWPELLRLMGKLGGLGGDQSEAMVLTRILDRRVDSGAPELERLRARVAGEVERILLAGRAVGAVRADLPIGLLVDLAMGSLLIVDGWVGAHLDAPDTSEVAARAFRGVRVMLEG